MNDRITDHDRRLVARARELAAIIERLDDDGSFTATAQIIATPQLAGAGAITADVLNWCPRCRHATLSTPCPGCDGPSCARCGRCPDCDGPVPDEEE